jgi:hypothetical protein
MALEFSGVSLQLRHDTKANWEKFAEQEKDPILLDGEIGIEVNPEDPSKNKVKIGDGVSRWTQLDYFYDIEAIIALALSQVPKGCTVYQKEKTATETTDSSILATIENPQNGDVTIITTKLTPKAGAAAVETQKSSYIYDATIARKIEIEGEDGTKTEETVYGDWVAITGNVDASKVILSKNIKLAGSYTSVGNINKGSNTATKDYECIGMSVQTLLENMLSQEVQPGNPTAPAASMTAYYNGTKFTSDTALEIGTKITFSAGVSCSTGSYTYEGTNTGVSISGYSTVLKNGSTTVETKTGASPSFTEISLGSGASYTMTVTATHTAGNVATTNLGKPSNPVKQIAAGTKTKTSNKITSFRPLLVYVGTDLSTVDASWFRTASGALNKPTSKGNTTSVPDLTIAGGTKRVLIAIPSAAKRTFSYIKDEAGLGTDVKDNFLPTKRTIKIKSFNNYDEVDYDVWCFENANGLSETKYIFTMANA